MSKYSSEDEFMIKNKSVIVYLFLIIAFIISVLYFDYFVLPTSKTNDIITHYAIRTSGGKNGSKQKVSYHYYTQKGFTFSTAKDYIEENDIEIQYSLLFKSVTEVRSKSKDYTNLLSNDLSVNGIQFYFCGVLLLSIAISVKILLSKKGFSENTFYNIVCFNGFMIFVCLYMTYLF
ncbi:hypothetical protein RB619_07435 [Flavobacterium sp. LHD-80]|uniref:hypothetical protein n=1 Tax=Flavobacterium sp. LHD-80 TaxID=3071411 RepID=UPI0027DEE968|nr:hypothetical protein [Flavobacterium sp. LHD-80]MDQ6470470.1 hypothetical protein [Flavobacterium sp. LHD-80]